MDLSTLANYASVIAAVIGAIALVAVLVELRILKRNVITSTQMSVMQDERDIWNLCLSVPALTEGLIRDKFASDNDGNTPAENAVVSMLIDHYEKLYYQHTQRAFPRELWPSWEAHITRMIAFDRIYPTWERSQSIYWSKFQKHFDPLVQAARKQHANRVVAQSTPPLIEPTGDAPKIVQADSG